MTVGRTQLRGRGHDRRGSALILVLVMTLSLAGLAVSAVLLTSSSSLVQRYYDKDKDFRFLAQAALATVKATVQRDTTISVPGDTAYRVFTASSINDASGTAIPNIRVNGYAAYTGDTAGTYIPFLTVMAQAYDTMGTRSVQRLDLWSESFSRYAFLVDTFLPSGALGAGLHIRGRVHGNRNWNSASAPGTYYYDTVSVVGSAVSGTSTYTGTVAVTSAKRIQWPTSSSLSALPTLATAGSLSFAQVGTYTASESQSNGVNVSGENVSGTSARSGTRLRFRPVDVNNNGVYDASEGFFEVFDLATGMDTANLRVDPVAAATVPAVILRTNSVLLNQCGLLTTIGGRREFFPIGRFRESWVKTRVQLSTAPVVTATAADSMGRYNTTDSMPNNLAVSKILGMGIGYARCFPAGSPYLMLTERYVNASCAIDSTVLNTPYGWGATAAGCAAALQYGGQDTTFTANARRCYLWGTAGLCAGTAGVNGQVRVGSWRAFGGTNTASPPPAVLQARETPYLWPISTTYNAASRGVIYATDTLPLYVSDTLRGYATLYSRGRIVLVSDVVYDQDPVASAALCRNFLGLITDAHIKVANNALNFPRRDPGATYRFLGTPNFNLHAAAMALSTTTSTSSAANIRAHGTVAIEDSSTTAVMPTAISCNGTSTSGGCWNHTGGATMKVYHQTSAGAGTGLVRNMTRDPCQARQTNRRPPFFPLTGRYVDYKASEVDPRESDTWAEIKTYLARLRGNNRKVP